MGKGLLLRDLKFGSMIPFVFASVFCNFGASNCLAGDQALGELKLEGEYVEHFVLSRKDGYTETFNNPEKTIRLPAGEYLLQDVRLKGGYIRNRMGGFVPVTVREGEQEILKVGAPLVPTVRVHRRGRFLILSYDLLGVGGDAYTNGDRSKPPSFAIYSGDKKIASDTFEYG